MIFTKSATLFTSALFVEPYSIIMLKGDQLPYLAVALVQAGRPEEVHSGGFCFQQSHSCFGRRRRHFHRSCPSCNLRVSTLVTCPGWVCGGVLVTETVTRHIYAIILQDCEACRTGHWIEIIVSEVVGGGVSGHIGGGRHAMLSCNTGTIHGITPCWPFLHLRLRQTLVFPQQT